MSFRKYVNRYKYIGDHDNILLIGDFYSEFKDENMCNFCDTYILQNFIKEPTCLKCTKSNHYKPYT